MSHPEQRAFFKEIKENKSEFFKNKKVLDIGSLDINGNNRYLFEDCEYYGLDIAEGPNVDILSIAHEYEGEDESYDFIVSNDCFEHDMFYEKTFKNIVRMLKPNGFFLFSCKTEGAGEHGTLRTDGGFSSPLTVKYPGWENYYKNITEKDVRDSIDVDSIFSEYEFISTLSPNDLRFWGIKK